MKILLKKHTTEEFDEGYFLEVNVQYRENVHDLRNYLLFLPERMKIEKVENRVAKIK